jgi:hypothetical protein
VIVPASSLTLGGSAAVKVGASLTEVMVIAMESVSVSAPPVPVLP